MSVEKYNVPFEYKGYTIDLDKEAYGTRYLFYPSCHREPQHDCDHIDDRFVYTGNCKFSDTIENCMNDIDQMENESNVRLISELLHAVGEMLLSLNRSSCNWNTDTAMENAYKLCKDVYKKATEEHGRLHTKS